MPHAAAQATDPAPTPVPGWPARLGRMLWWWQLAGMLLSLAWLVAVIPMKMDITFPEGALVARALDVAAGHSPYQDWREWPHAFAPYGPLAYAVPGWISQLFPGAPGVWQGYLAGRLVSLGSIFLLIIAVALCVYRMGVGWWWGVPAMALVLRWQSLWQYCVSFRPDAPRTLLAVLAVGVALGRPATPRRIALAFGLLWLSFWFKPTGIAILVVLLLWVWLDRGWRVSVLCAAAFTGSGLLLFMFLNHLWGGLLKLNMVDSLRNGLELSCLQRYITDWHAPVDLLLPAASIAGIVFAWQSRHRLALRLLLPVLLGVPLSYGLALAQALKAGADKNYFLEPLVLAAVLGGWGAAHLWQRTLRAPRPWALAWLLVIAWLAYDVAQQASFLPLQLKTVRPSYREFPIARELARQPGPVLAMVSWLGLAPRDKATVLDYFQYRNLVTRGLLDPASLRQRLAQKQISAVVLTDVEHNRAAALPLWSVAFGSGFYDTLLQHYDERGNLAAFYIFTPKP